jgi:signal peptidase II
LKNIFKSHPWLSLVIALDLILFLFMIDQVNKWAMLELVIRPAVGEVTPGLDFITWITALELPRYPFTQIEIWPFHNIVMVWNQGISFGLFADHPAAGAGLLMVGLLAIVLGFTVWLVRTSDHMLRFILAVIIGGALGNLWDRVRFGAVADFYDYHAFGWHYPAFNIADSLIVCGVLALLARELFFREKSLH